MPSPSPPPPTPPPPPRSATAPAPAPNGTPVPASSFFGTDTGKSTPSRPIPPPPALPQYVPPPTDDAQMKLDFSEPFADPPGGAGSKHTRVQDEAVEGAGWVGFPNSGSTPSRNTNWSAGAGGDTEPYLSFDPSAIPASLPPPYDSFDEHSPFGFADAPPDRPRLGPGVFPPLLARQISENRVYIVCAGLPKRSSSAPPPPAPPAQTEGGAGGEGEGAGEPARVPPPPLTPEEVASSLPTPTSSFFSPHTQTWLTLHASSSPTLPTPDLASRFPAPRSPPFYEPPLHHPHYHNLTPTPIPLPLPVRQILPANGASPPRRPRSPPPLGPDGVHDIVITPPGSPGRAPEPTWSVYADDASLLNVSVCADTHSIIGRELADALVQSRMKNPGPDGNAKNAVKVALGVIYKSIENALDGELRALPVTGKSYSSKLGWDPISQEIYARLGFVLVTDTENRQVLTPPHLGLDKPDELEARARLCRAWLEVGCWYADWIASNELGPWEAQNLTIEDAGASVLEILGGSKTQMARITPLSNARPADFAVLGATPDLPSRTLIAAYHAQLRSDPLNASGWFSSLSSLEPQMPYSEREELQVFVQSERSKGAYTEDEVVSAYAALGISEWGVPFESVSDEMLVDAWENRSREAEKNVPLYSWTGQGGGAEDERAKLREALDVLGRKRRSGEIREALKRGVREKMMSCEEALAALAVPRDAEDDTIFMVYDVRMMDQPGQEEKWKAAVAAIAKDRGSARLQRFVETGERDLDAAAGNVVSEDKPVGLNNIGNTCYLNSLLQYFFTIRELRETILEVEKYEEDPHAPDADARLALKRVGGRAVSRREIERSKEFVQRLSGLYQQLVWSNDPAVTPELDLAYLSLVTTKDEKAGEGEGEDVAMGGTTTAATTAASTEATLVDEPLPISPAPAPEAGADETLSPRSRSTVLGKRKSEDAVSTAPAPASAGEMEVDPPEPPVPVQVEPDDFVLVDKPVQQGQGQQKTEGEGEDAEMVDGTERAGRENGEAEAQGEAEKQKIEPPPLPPRKPKKVERPQGTGGMMFGKQHDVSECMDNMLFQMQAALDPLKLPAQPGEEGNLIQRLFFGKTRQRLRFDEPVTGSGNGGKGRSSVHDKDEVFGHIVAYVDETPDRDLYDVLDTAFEGGPVEIEGRAAQRDVTAVQLPPILQIQLQRVQYDRTVARAFKSNALVRFDRSLKMDRYVDPGTDVARGEKREKSKRLKAKMERERERLREIKGPKVPGTPLDVTLDETATLLGSPGFAEITADLDTELVETLKSEAEALRIDAHALEQSIKVSKAELEALWAEDEQDEYELASVFMHRGDATFGHYWLCARALPDHPDKWFKYNDSYVTEVNEREVFTEAAYLLVYVRKGAEKIETVKRSIIA